MMLLKALRAASFYAVWLMRNAKLSQQARQLLVLLPPLVALKLKGPTQRMLDQRLKKLWALRSPQQPVVVIWPQSCLTGSVASHRQVMLAD